MNSSSFLYTSIAVFVALTLIITMSPTSYAQPTFDTPSSPGSSSPETGSSTGTGAADDGENFPQFMECLFGGEVSEEDISNALDGSSGSTPTEQEIRDCFAPLYNTGGAAGSTTTTTTPGSGGSTDETEDAGGDEADGTSGASSEDDDESEE